MRRLRLAIAAEESAGVKLVRALAAGEHEIVRVFCSPSDAAVRGATVDRVARGLDLPVEPARRVRDPALATELRELGVDLLINAHSLYILAAEVVAAPTIGSFNLHPGPLPEYAGLNAPSWAIFHGASEYGVTVHWMEAGIDTGPIAFEERFPIGPDETGLSLGATCIRRGVPLLERLVAQAAADPEAIPRRAQDLSRRRVFRRREVPFDGRIRWDEPAEVLERFVRAADFHPLPSPWGVPRASRGGTPFGIVKVAGVAARRAEAAPGTVLGTDEGDVAEIACGTGALRVSHAHSNGRVVRAGTVLAVGERLDDGAPSD